MLESSFRTAYLKTGCNKRHLEEKGKLNKYHLHNTLSGNSLHCNFSYEKLREPAEQIISDVAY